MESIFISRGKRKCRARQFDIKKLAETGMLEALPPRFSASTNSIANKNVIFKGLNEKTR